MSESRAIDTVSGLDYEEIEQAVMETARGRWFLTEFARRQRASDTKVLLDAIRRLEDQLLAMPAAGSRAATEAAIERTTPEKQLAAPAAETVQAGKPDQTSPPKFVSSDDDLFEAAPAPAPVAPVRPARNLGADTLDFSSIEVPPMPERISDSEDGEDAEQQTAAEQAPAAPSVPLAASREDELKARDRVIQVTRSSTANSRRLSDFGAPPDLNPNGRINVSAPATANQIPTPATPSATAMPGRNSADEGSQKKRIIVIRRPAEGTDGIPLAGE